MSAIIQNIINFFNTFFKGQKPSDNTPVIVAPIPEPKPTETPLPEANNAPEASIKVEPIPATLPPSNSDDDLIRLIVEKITGDFEGEKLWDDITGNDDGMGLSVGALQWCYGQGSLQSKILRPYIEKYGSIDKLKIFPERVSMDESAHMTDAQGIKFAVDEMHLGHGLKLAWKEAWSQFLLKPEVIDIQTKACYSVLRTARQLAKDWDMDSKVAIIWFFDVITQNGSLKGIQRPTYDLNEASRIMSLVDLKCRGVWQSIYLPEVPKDQIILFIASHRRASKSRKEYINDVFSRKGTIALGKGVVHGDKFDFTHYYK